MSDIKYRFTFKAELEKKPDGTDAPEAEFYKDFVLMQRIDPETGIEEHLQFFVNVLRLLTYSEDVIKRFIDTENLL